MHSALCAHRQQCAGAFSVVTAPATEPVTSSLALTCAGTVAVAHGADDPWRRYRGRYCSQHDGGDIVHMGVPAHLCVA